MVKETIIKTRILRLLLYILKSRILMNISQPTVFLLGMLIALCASTGLAQEPIYSFVLNSPLDPVKTFTIVREHRYTFDNNPNSGPVLKGTAAGLQGTANPPAVVGDPQLSFGDINPCAGVYPTVNNFVITGIEAHSKGIAGTLPLDTGMLDLVKITENRPTQLIRRYERFFRDENFHDKIGIRMAGDALLRLDTAMWGAGRLVGSPPVLVPQTYKVVTIITGYCADELLNPPTNP